MTILSAVAFCGALCSASARITVLERVGPDPNLGARDSTEGFLEVYSAREQAPIDVNAETFFYNNDFGKNEFLRTPAHTTYSIYAADGRLLQRVRNHTGMNDDQPTLVKLAPGDYRIRAEAEDSAGLTMTVMVPVCVEPGMTTTVHLDGKWAPATAPDETQIVRLRNGTAVGWHCSGSTTGKYASASGN
jgi:hypothetical protein